MKVWIVLMWITEGVTEFHGVFDDEEKAVAACRDENYGIGPAIMNEDLPDETTEWDGFYYPHERA